MIARCAEILSTTTAYLAAAAEAQTLTGSVDVEALAGRHDVAADALAGWLDYLGNTQDPVKIVGHFTNRMTKVGGYDFVQGWGVAETPLLVANSSDQEAHIPGLMKPHSVAVHPAPATQAVVAWQSPCDATLQVSTIVARADTACGNGITWCSSCAVGTPARHWPAARAISSRRPQPGRSTGSRCAPAIVFRY